MPLPFASPLGQSEASLCFPKDKSGLSTVVNDTHTAGAGAKCVFFVESLVRANYHFSENRLAAYIYHIVFINDF